MSEPTRHCRQVMEKIGEVHLASKVHIGFPLEPGKYHIFKCTDPSCDQIAFVPFTLAQTKEVARAL